MAMAKTRCPPRTPRHRVTWPSSPRGHAPAAGRTCPRRPRPRRTPFRTLQRELVIFTGLRVIYVDNMLIYIYACIIHIYIYVLYHIYIYMNVTYTQITSQEPYPNYRRKVTNLRFFRWSNDKRVNTPRDFREAKDISFTTGIQWVLRCKALRCKTYGTHFFGGMTIHTRWCPIIS